MWGWATSGRPCMILIEIIRRGGRVQATDSLEEYDYLYRKYAVWQYEKTDRKVPVRFAFIDAVLFALPLLFPSSSVPDMNLFPALRCIYRYKR